MRYDLISQRLLEVIKLEVKSLGTPNCGFNYALRKWKAVITNKRCMKFLGSDFFFEDRLQPFSLFNYVNEVLSLKKIFKFKKAKGLRVLDVGANIGNYGYVLMKLFPESEVYSFEPNEEPFKYLQVNAVNFSRWNIFNYGVGSTLSEVDFYFVPEKSGQGSIYKENASLNLLNAKTPVKTTVTLKPLTREFLENNCRGIYFDFVKIDVEGAETEVIKGLSNIEWRMMYVELSNDRGGATKIDDFMVMINETQPRARVVKSVNNQSVIDLFILNED